MFYCSVGVFLFILLVGLCAISEGARYRAKFLIFIVLCAISATWSIPIMFLRIGDWRNALIPAWGARVTARLLGVRYEVRGKENIVKDSGSIVLMNHQSALDLCVLAELWPVLERCTVISKWEVKYFGTFGLASWLWGTIFIDRHKPSNAQTSVNSTAKIINQRKAKVLMFPEGKRYSRNHLMPFKKGGFHLAIQCQAPIQPVVISKYYFLHGKLKKFDSGISYINILPAIPTEGLSKDEINDLVDKTYKVMNEKFQETSQEALAAHLKTLKTE